MTIEAFLGGFVVVGVTETRHHAGAGETPGEGDGMRRVVGAAPRDDRDAPCGIFHRFSTTAICSCSLRVTDSPWCPPRRWRWCRHPHDTRPAQPDCSNRCHPRPKHGVTSATILPRNMDNSPDFQGVMVKLPFEKQGRQGTNRVTIRHKTYGCTRAGQGPKQGAMPVSGARCHRIRNNGRETIYDSLPGRNGHRHGQAWHRQ